MFSRRLRLFAATLIWAVLLCCVSTASAESYLYDALGRLTTVSFDNGLVVTYSYDAAGNRTQISATGGPPILSATIPSPIYNRSYSQLVPAVAGTPPFTFSETGTLPTGISLTAAGLLSGKTTAVGSYTFTIQATDSKNLVGSESVNWTIIGPPVISAASLPTPVYGQAYSKSVQATGGSQPLTYAVTSGSLPSGISMTPAGIFSGSSQVTSASNFTLTVTDANQLTGIQNFSWTIAAPPTIASGSLPTPVFGQTYSKSIQASGGSKPLTYAVTSGSLPSGISMTSAGVFSGSSTVTTRSTFTISVTDANGLSGAQNFAWTILPSPVITSASLPTPIYGQPYTKSAQASGGTQPLTYAVTSGSLPSGISMTAAGVFSGSSKVTTATTFTITVTDLNQLTGMQTFTWSIAPPPAFSASPLPSPILKSPYSQSIGITGGTAPFNYSVTSGSLPPGVALSASGVFSGTPTTVGTYPFTVTVKDVNGLSAAQPYSWNILPGPVISPISLNAPIYGVPYSAQLSSVGGAQPITYTVTKGALPTGITLSSSGLLAGVLAASGTFNFTITATDTDGLTGGQDYAWSIAVPPAVNASPNPHPVYGQPFSQTYFVNQSGGGPYRFSETGALPTGLQAATNSAGTGITISGTPTSFGTYNLSLNVADPTGANTSVHLTWTITAPPTWSTTTLPNAEVTQAYQQQLVVTGGRSPVTFALSGAAVFPAGISLGSSGLVSGVPTALNASGPYAVNIVATDGDGLTATQPLTLNLVGAPVVAPQTLANPVYGVPYNQTLSATGGVGQVSFAVTSGSLPPGLNLTSGGVLSGTVTSVAQYKFTVTATDANKVTGFQAYTFTIGAPPVFGVTGPLTAIYGTAYSQDLLVQGAKPISCVVSSGALPSGITVGAGCVLSGKSSVAQVYKFSLAATDVNGASTAEPYVLTILPPPTFSTTFATPIVGQSYNQTVQVTGDVAGLAVKVSSGQLPSGLTLSPTVGISGNVATVGITGKVPASGAGAYSFTLQAANADGLTASQTFTGTIAAPPTILANSLPRGITTQTYSQTIATSGGTQPFSWSVSQGSLPPGLSLASGVISGTPTTAGTYSFTVTVQDANQITASQPLSITIVAAPVIAFQNAGITSPLNLMQNVNVGYNLITNGGTPPFTYALSSSSGPLPKGMTFTYTNSIAFLSGTPTVSGSFPIQITSTDATGLQGNLSVTLSVASPIAFTTPATLQATLATPFSTKLAASGGTAPYSFSDVGGSGQFSVAVDGTVSGPSLSQGAAAVSFVAGVQDKFGYSTTQTFSVSVPPAPVAGNASAVTSYNAPVVVALPITGSFTTINPSVASQDTFSLNGANLTFTPGLLTWGQVQILYTATGPGGTSNWGTITITVGNPPPPQSLNASASTLMNNSVTIGLPTSGLGAPANIVSPPTNGTVSTISSNSVVYTPKSGFYGTDSFTFNAAGPGGTGNTGTISISVAAYVPSVSNQTAAVAFDTATTINLPSSGPTTSLSLGTGPTNGTLSNWTSSSVLYTPANGFSGQDSFTYSGTGPGGTSGFATVSITVANPPPAAPVAGPVNVTVPYFAVTPIALNLSGSYASWSVVSPPQHGTILSQVGNTVNYGSRPSYAGPDSFTYVATSSTGTNSPPGTVNITILPPPAPTIENISGKTNYNTQLKLNAIWDTGNVIGYQISTQPKNGTASISIDGLITYVPNTGFYGVDTFAYTATGLGNTVSQPATVTVTVIPPPPTAGALTASVAYSGPTQIQLAPAGAWTNVYLPGNATSQTLFYGSVTINGAVATYTPNSTAPLTGATDYIGYYVTGPGGASAEAWVRVNIQASPPVAEAQFNPNAVCGISNNGAPVTLSIAQGPWTSLSLDTTWGGPPYGTAVQSGSSLIYTPYASSIGATNYANVSVIAATNSGDNSAAGAYYVVINGDLTQLASQPPIAQAHYAISVAPDKFLTGNICPSGNFTSITPLAPPKIGKVVFNGNSFTYTASTTFVDSDSFTYTVTGPGGTATGTVTVYPTNY